MSKYSARGADWQRQRLRVLERDGWTCQSCSEALDQDNATVDHVEPISLQYGKDYEDAELLAMCRPCNSRKGSNRLVRVEFRSPDWFKATG